MTMQIHIEPSVTARFWAHVIPGPRDEDCWVWAGAIGDDGYGRLWTARRALRPHRYSYVLAGGHLATREPLLHACDFPLCVRPEHTYRGTDAKNMQERSARGRFANQHTSLTFIGSPREHRVRTMRHLRERIKRDGYDSSAIAKALAGYDPDHPTLFDI